MTDPAVAPFRSMPFMGVIRVNEEAAKLGFDHGPSWANLGQGQPEVGALEGAPPRIDRIDIDVTDNAYGPVEGLPELREAVAAHYNRLFRRGHASQYTAENVAIGGGGRLTLSRAGAALDEMRLGYFTPDYTAYEDLLTTFHRVNPVHIELRASEGFRIDPKDLDARVGKDRLGALVISNPCNPTGTLVCGDELGAWMDIGRRRGCAMLMDEYYSHYVYKDGFDDGPVSSAAYVEDVNRDPVIIFDGLTKCFRYPGWRCGWVVAPKDMIRTLTASGSFLDGGPSRPIQRAAIEVLEPSRADRETNAVRKAFRAKRDVMVAKLTAMGVTFVNAPESTFYAWGCIENLPAPLNEGLGFMRAGFEQKVLTVPGAYFDVNPHRRRPAPSPFDGWVRFSFGPPMETVKWGLERLGEMVTARAPVGA